MKGSGRMVYSTVSLAGAMIATLLLSIAPMAKILAAESGLLTTETITRMRAAREDYARIDRAGGWPLIPVGSAMRRGDTGPRIEALRVRLVMSGDLDPDGPPIFDAAMEAAVMRFQSRHGQVPSGVVYQSTREALNVSIATRIQELDENIARLDGLRSLAASQRQVVVNIPAYELEAVEEGQVALRSRVVVGKIESPTPRLDAEITSVTVMPYWHVPRSLVMRDLRSILETDPDYLGRNRIRVFSIIDGLQVPRDPSVRGAVLRTGERLMFRQDPGPFNAMGLYRINMPNDQQVLLHDTPEKEHFDQAVRAFSAGCVRVEKIGALVEWLLGSSVRAATDRADRGSGIPETRVEHLESAVTVQLVYITAWIDGLGQAQFRPDIYRRHRRMPVDAKFVRDRLR